MAPRTTHLLLGRGTVIRAAAAAAVERRRQGRRPVASDAATRGFRWQSIRVHSPRARSCLNAPAKRRDNSLRVQPPMVARVQSACLRELKMQPLPATRYPTIADVADCSPCSWNQTM